MSQNVAGIIQWQGRDLQVARPYFKIEALFETWLEANRDEARRLVGEKTLRTWLIYMAGSAHAFARGWISIYQLLGVKAQGDGLASCPLTRVHVAPLSFER